jgi:uncharacterized protein (DUF2147 family)
MKFLFSICLLFLCSTVFSQKKTADDVIGTWITANGKARVEIYKDGKFYSGKIVWLKEPLKDGKPKHDIKNPSPALRTRLVVALIILRGFKFDGDEEWQDGEIYDPESGKTYSCKITMPASNILKVRGYIGISLLGRTEVWKRLQN